MFILLLMPLEVLRVTPHLYRRFATRLEWNVGQNTWDNLPSMVKSGGFEPVRFL
jgi:hypothetical protein